MADVTITPLDNGPYLVKGPVKIIDADGSVYEVKKETVALCRCGGSCQSRSAMGRTARSHSPRPTGP